MCTTDAVKRVANYLQIEPGKLTYNREQVVERSAANTNCRGFTTILIQMEKECKNRNLSKTEESLERQAEIEQWIDYAAFYVGPGLKEKSSNRQLFKELNDYLENRSYFVGFSLTLADIAMFYAMYNLMAQLTPIEKEHYLNLSRWFDHLQRNKNIRQDLNLQSFTSIFLHGWATGTHL